MAIRVLPLLDETAVAQIDFRYRLRAQTLKAVDDMVAGIFNALSSTGQLDSTYIFFMSDNGFENGEHRMPLGKATCYEESIRVPLAVRGPGIPPGGKIENMALNVDLAPTFAAIAGAAVPDFVDGRSLMGVLREGPVPLSEWRQAFIAETWDVAGNITKQAVRTKDCKYVRLNTGEIEFYNLLSDPYELQSLHDSVSRELLQKYSDWLGALSHCAGQSCKDIENLPPPQ